jgi:hypothetical protein
MGHTSRSSDLLHVKPSQAKVSNLPHGGCVEFKLKMDGSMRQAASDHSASPLPFSLYYVLGVF